MADVIVALDVPSADEARGLVDRLGDRGDFYKVGLELYTRAGPAFVRELTESGKRVFLDLKLHDIPNTVGAAVRAAVDLNVDLLTVHASGGPRMMQAAVDASGDGRERLRLLAVTVLTSMTADDLEAAWGREDLSVSGEVERLTDLAVASGVHGVVASPLEARRIRARTPEGFLIATPGIRPSGADAGDQKRVATPADAVWAGADHLVIGRAITRAPDPAAALAAVLDEVSGARAGAS